MSCKSSTYFEPTTVQRKHACPGTSKYGNMSRRRYKNNDEAISGSNSDEGKDQGPTLLKRVGSWLPSMPHCSWPSIRPWIPFIHLLL